MFQRSTEVSGGYAGLGLHVASNLDDSWMSLDLGECLATGKSKWLARKAKGDERDQGFCLTGEVLESGVSHCVAVHSPLMSPQYWSKLCFRVPLRLQEDRCFGVASSLDGSWMSLGLGDPCPRFSFYSQLYSALP